MASKNASEVHIPTRNGFRKLNQNKMGKIFVETHNYDVIFWVASITFLLRYFLKIRKNHTLLFCWKFNVT